MNAPVSQLSRQLKRLWPALKWGMFLIVLAFVAYHGFALWRQYDGKSTHVRWGWLGLAIATSVFAWLPSAWYWRRLLSELGVGARWPDVARAYYCGHLGKYVPGKAAVIVIRSALLRNAGVPATAAALTVTVESLTYMWAGALLLVALYPFLAPQVAGRLGAAFGTTTVRVVLIVAVVYVGAFVLRTLMRSHRRLANAFRSVDPQTPTVPETRSLETSVAGVCVFLVAWWAQGLTLGLTIAAVSDGAIAWHDWPLWTATAAASLVGGFVAIFAPGGIGVREGLLMEILKGHVGPHEAVVIALLLRGVSLAGEILTAALLYYGLQKHDE